MNKKLIYYLENKSCFKLICGANNQNYDEIEKLCALYLDAGCVFFDLEASKSAISAFQKALDYTNKNREDVFVCISLGANQDPHISKCKINKNCKRCKKCMKVCMQNAIIDVKSKLEIIEKSCIGCKKCLKVCKHDAIEHYQNSKKWKSFLPELLPFSDCVEFHMISDDIKEINKKWEYLCEIYDGMLSICTDRSMFGDNKLIKQLKKMIKKADRKIIIQADGNPMSGGSEDNNTTLQAIACADLINKSDLNAYVFLSGGTNFSSKELAQYFQVDNTGIAIGSCARKKVKDFIIQKDFLDNQELFQKASLIIKDELKKLS